MPPGAPLRDPETGAIIGNTPFMSSLIVTISLIFLVCGICYGLGAGTMKSVNDVVTAMTKAIAGLSGLILLLLVISQFIAYFNYSNMATLAAISLADVLTEANLGPLWLLVGFVIVVFILDLGDHRRDPEVGDLRPGVHTAADAPQHGAGGGACRLSSSATRR